MSQLPNLPNPGTDPLTYAQQQLGMGIPAAAVAQRVGEMFPTLLGAGALTVVRVAEQSRASAESAAGVVAGTSPAYATPPTVGYLPPGATQFDVRFVLSDPRTGRTRVVIVRDMVYGALTREAVLYAIQSFMDQRVPSVSFPFPPEYSRVEITSIVQGPGAP